MSDTFYPTRSMKVYANSLMVSKGTSIWYDVYNKVTCFQVSTCSKCGGNGKLVTDFCRSCNGEGKIEGHRSIKVDIPAGVNDGYTIQINGEGSYDKKR